jgi:uncharacterized protein YdaU (DUF1376 family)
MQHSGTPLENLKVDVFMPLYIGKYLQDTTHLDGMKSGAYLHLLMYFWIRGPLPNDHGELATIAKLTPDAWSITKAAVMHFFFLGPDGLWHQKGAERLKDEWMAKRQKAHDKAVKAARARWDKQKAKKGDAPSIARAMPYNVKEQVQKQKKPTPTPPTSREGIDAPSMPMHQASRPPGASSSTIAPAAAPANKRKKSETADLGPTTGQNEQQGGNHRQSSRSSMAPGRNLLPRYSKNGAQPQKTDSREERFKGEVFGFWAGQNPEGPKCPWGGSDERALVDLLNNNRELSFEEFKRLLRNRASSEVNPAAPPYKWLRSVLEYSAGPLGKFGKPLKPPRHL